ncbi:type IV secretory system conjugative DNA transfer family protein [Nakamurella multipartita]|nr:hypothetical protein [Nakamurella multipartita]
MSRQQVLRRLTRAGTSMPNPGNTDTRMRGFASALGRFPVTLLTTSDGNAVTHHLLTPARQDFPNAALSLAHAVGAQIDVVDDPPYLSGTRVVGFLRADVHAPAVHATTRGGDAAETARRVETALRHRTDDTTWVAATLRRPRRRERRRTDRWYTHRLGSAAPVHHYRDPNAVAVTVTAGGDSAEQVRGVLSQVAAALPGFDIATRTRILRPTLTLTASVLLSCAAVAAVAALGSIRAAMLLAAALVVLLGCLVTGRIPGTGHRTVRAARRCRFDAPPLRRTVPARPSRGHPATENRNEKAATPGDYPLHLRVFLMGPGLLAGLVAPHSGAAAGQVSTRQRTAPAALLDPGVGPWIGHPDGLDDPQECDRVRLSAADMWRGVAAFGEPGSGKSALLAALYGWHCLERVTPSGRPGFPGRRNGLIAFENKGAGTTAYLRYAHAAGDQPLLVEAGDPATYGIDVFHVPTRDGRPLSVAERARVFTNMLVYAFADGEIQGRAYESLSATITAALTVTGDIAADAGLPVAHSPVFYAHVLCGGRGDTAAVDLARAITSAAVTAEKAGRPAAADLTEADTRLAFLFTGRVTEARRRDATESARRRLGELLAAEAWWTPNRPKVTWEQVVSGHHSVLINTGSTTSGITLDSRVTGYLSAILMFALRDTVERICVGWRDQGRATTIFADELKLLSADSADIIAWLHDQGRDYGVRKLFATQRDDQLPPALLTSVLDYGTVLWFSQNNPDTAARAAKDLAAGSGEGSWTPDEIINLDQYHAIVRATVDARRQPAVPVRLEFFGDRPDMLADLQGYRTELQPDAVDAPLVPATRGRR